MKLHMLALLTSKVYRSFVLFAEMKLQFAMYVMVDAEALLNRFWLCVVNSLSSKVLYYASSKRDYLELVQNEVRIQSWKLRFPLFQCFIFI